MGGLLGYPGSFGQALLESQKKGPTPPKTSSSTLGTKGEQEPENPSAPLFGETIPDIVLGTRLLKWAVYGPVGNIGKHELHPTVEARKLEYDHPKSLEKKEHHHKPSYVHIQTVWSLL